MTKQHRSFSAELIREAAGLVLDQGDSHIEASRSLVVVKSALRRWVKRRISSLGSNAAPNRARHCGPMRFCSRENRQSAGRVRPPTAQRVYRACLPGQGAESDSDRSGRLFASRGDSVTRGKAGTLLILVVSLMNDDSAGILLNDSRGRESSDEF